MAVQAQYPSNVLLLNRNGQEGHDYPLQPQPGGFLDQSYMLFNNGGSSNPRKRGREVAATTTITAAPINPFSMQSQAPQLVNISQLHNHQQPNVVSTGLRLSFGEQQQQQQQLQQTHHHQQHQQQQQQNIMCQSPSFLSFLSEDLATQIKRQRDELDQFLQAQGEQLRRSLAEKRQRHYRTLLGAAEESIARRLREKEAEVEKATRRNAELEARAAQLSVEAQVWQAKARAQEATAASLQAQLQQAIMSGAGGAQDSRRGDDGLMCTGEVAEDAESAYVDPDRVLSLPVSGPSCKACRKGVASVVLLPCRHLCVCTECDRVIQACPLCFNVRDSSVEVFLS
ncbi:BOI-related E3 ubiquitin-protein ligase 1-like [Melia azedarach]|uniref:BOI-related E3 ubiquitin-protein ligase 1-like n=2 Tax=Melia azedarach TaxID=155640 RepID=A0ACC1XNY0_MELAZ|nr:BOI-related E3 ubiquitin-protein ligase 1-like [Melia azedarach]KAJ4712588.1 BOI-related E3 ubiquitin-protein ligase 1-like [Melia azedarach]